MKKQIISLLLICCIVLTAICSHSGVVEAKNSHSYVTYQGAFQKNISISMKIKKGKLIVTGKFFDMELKEPWKHPVTMKKRKFTISKNVKYEEETEERDGKISKKKFFKNYKKYYTVGFDVKNGKVIMMFYSVFEPQL